MHIELDRDSRQPLYLQLHSAPGMILTGALPAGASFRLPGKWRAARASRNTVDEAWMPGRRRFAACGPDGAHVRGDIRPATADRGYRLGDADQ